MSLVYFELAIPQTLYQMLEERAERMGLDVEEYWLVMAVNEVKNDLQSWKP